METKPAPALHPAAIREIDQTAFEFEFRIDTWLLTGRLIFHKRDRKSKI